MADANLPVGADRIVTGAHSAEEWRRLVETYLETHTHPTAMITAQNFVTVGAVQALHRHGLQHRIAQVGFDDVDLADVVEPGITVVPQRPRNLGRRAAEMLLARIDGDQGPPMREVVAAPLIIRGSGELTPIP